MVAGHSASHMACAGLSPRACWDDHVLAVLQSVCLRLAMRVCVSAQCHALWLGCITRHWLQSGMACLLMARAAGSTCSLRLCSVPYISPVAMHAALGGAVASLAPMLLLVRASN
jgi:hypothetical protein